MSMSHVCCSIGTKKIKEILVSQLKKTIKIGLISKTPTFSLLLSVDGWLTMQLGAAAGFSPSSPSSPLPSGAGTH